jgi:ABC-type bacteriocin/lantibiotic exporter with double-glycine peptidase domain
MDIQKKENHGGSDKEPKNKYLAGISSWWSNSKKSWKISYQLSPQVFFIRLVIHLGSFIIPTITLLAVQPVLKIFKNGLQPAIVEQYALPFFIIIFLYMVFIFIRPYLELFLENKFKMFPIEQDLFIKDILQYIPYEYAIDSKKSFKVDNFESFIEDLFSVTKDQIGIIVSIFSIVLGFSVGIGLDPVFMIFMIISALFSIYIKNKRNIQNFYHKTEDEQILLSRRSREISKNLNFPSLSSKLANQVRWLRKNFNDARIELAERGIVRKRTEILADRKTNLFDIFSKICILIYVVFKIKQGQVVDVMAAYYVSNTIIGYIHSLGRDVIKQTETAQKLEFVNEIMNVSEQEKTMESSKEYLDISNGITIVFENVSFQYPNEDVYVFKNMSLELSLDKLYGLQGDNGNGKTTVFKLINGFLQPTEGTITINGIDTKNIKRSWFNDNFCSYSPEMDIINSITVREFLTVDSMKNINSGNHLTMIKNILHDVGLSEKIPDADINTLVLDPRHPNGTDFSSGQAQRLLIARMIMNLCGGAKYVLADEMTSNISFDHQKDLALLLKKYSTGGILIAHNPKMIEVCDEVLICKNKTIFIQKQQLAY